MNWYKSKYINFVVKVDPQEAANCNEAMDSLTKFYDKFSIDTLDIKGKETVLPSILFLHTYL